MRDSALNRAPSPLIYAPLAQLSNGITAINADLQPLAFSAWFCDRRLWLALAGLAIGLSLAMGLTRFMTALLFGVTRSDPFTFVVVSAVLCASATVAAWYPARRAGRVAPITSLRLEE